MFEELKNAGVAVEGIILKSSMVLPGKKSGTKAAPEEVAKETVEVFNKTLPANLAGVVFLSGGQGDIEATENLNAINRQPLQGKPRSLAINFFLRPRFAGCRISKAWKGAKRKSGCRAKSFYCTALKMNSLASQGKYSSDLESGFEAVRTRASGQPKLNLLDII